MKFMLIRRADKDTEAGVIPSQELFAAMMKYNEQSGESGCAGRRRRAATEFQGSAG